ncbi:TPA: MFS transporter [Streptococcus suis]|nr:MFS transporter [Streptococcus suis]
MNLNVTIDWKVVAALGVSVMGIILSLKIDDSAAERVLTTAVSTQLGN